MRDRSAGLGGRNQEQIVNAHVYNLLRVILTNMPRKPLILKGVFGVSSPAEVLMKKELKQLMNFPAYLKNRPAEVLMKKELKLSGIAPAVHAAWSGRSPDEEGTETFVTVLSQSPRSVRPKS